MVTLRLKPNSRKIPPLVISKVQSSEWEFNDVGVMHHNSGFMIQFFNRDECEITNIPDDMSLTTVRELTSEAIKARNRRFR